MTGVCVTLALLLLVTSPVDSYDVRHVVRGLSVRNGGSYGTWERVEFCGVGLYASGFELKVQEGGRDESAVNAIELVCDRVRLASRPSFYGKATSGTGPFGYWTGRAQCPRHDGLQKMLISFRLNVQPDQGRSGDNTAVNNVMGYCAGLEDKDGDAVEGHGGVRGEWGEWSDDCPVNSAICGIATKVHFGDDNSGINDVRCLCCDD